MKSKNLTYIKIRDIFLPLNDFSVYSNKSLQNIFIRVVMSGICQELSIRKTSAEEFGIRKNFVFLDRYRGKKSIMDKKCSAYHVGHLL